MDTASEIGKSVLKWASNTIVDARYKVDGMVGTEIERKVKAATSNESWGTSGTLKNEIALATYQHGETYNQIMSVIWERLENQTWRVTFKTLTLLDYLIKCGSQLVIDECRIYQYRIRTLRRFEMIDDDMIDRGKGIRSLAEKICAMLDNQALLLMERQEAARLNNIMNQNIYGQSSYPRSNLSQIDSRNKSPSYYRYQYENRTSYDQSVPSGNLSRPSSIERHKQLEELDSFRTMEEKKKENVSSVGENFGDFGECEVVEKRGGNSSDSALTELEIEMEPRERNLEKDEISLIDGDFKSAHEPLIETGFDRKESDSFRSVDDMFSTTDDCSKTEKVTHPRNKTNPPLESSYATLVVPTDPGKDLMDFENPSEETNEEIDELSLAFSKGAQMENLSNFTTPNKDDSTDDVFKDLQKRRKNAEALSAKSIWNARNRDSDKDTSEKLKKETESKKNEETKKMLEKMIPGSSLVDLDCLSGKKPSESFRKADKPKMNKMNRNY